jgi:integrase
VPDPAMPDPVADPVSPATGELLAALEHAAAEHVAAQVPPNTRRAYADDWRVWTTYTAGLGIPETTGTAGALVGYVAWLERAAAAPATIDRRLTGAVAGLRERGVEPGRAASRAARAALAGYRRRLAAAGEQPGRGQAPALGVAALRRCCRACPDTTAGRRDRALLLLAWTIAGRRSEVAGLRLADVVDDPEGRGLVVAVRTGKTTSSVREVAVPRGSHPDTCPVTAWHAWRAELAAHDLTDDPAGPALRRVDRHGRILGGLSGQAAGTVLTRAAERAGLAGVTGHSARAGLATAARRAGHDSTAIAAQGGWAPGSRALAGYLRIEDRWSDNAAAGTGL